MFKINESLEAFDFVQIAELLQLEFVDSRDNDSELVLFRRIRLEKALGEKFLALEGYGLVDLAKEVVLGRVEGADVKGVLDVNDGAKVGGLVVLVVFLFDLALALEGGEAVGGILCNLWVGLG
ncbi:hypothetical protein Fmac_014945 [Flemingia macrophylla]|uniref:Uncharacterized protein n=1 Tax=Flemingia macrophylla TaxID=520843 RepID=A0ABD1MD57_9FABA